jgi:PIN domain nuclease of toxin-antitoxin system
MRILLDTHAWIWWVAEDKRLSKDARAAIERAQRTDTLWLSAISIWEVSKKVEKGQLVFDRALDQWLDLATAVTGLTVAELSRHVLVESCRLPQPFHGDPADQLIVATAREEQATVVTKDERMRGYEHVRTVW